MSSSVIGVHDIVQTLLSDSAGGGILVQDHSKFAGILNVLDSKSQHWKVLFNNGTYKSYDLIRAYLTYWIQQQGEEATIEKFSATLADNSYKLASEELLNKFNKDSLIVCPGIHEGVTGFVVSKYIHNVPHPTLKFHGRTNQLDKLANHFKSEKQKTFLINGLGGVGKTELVRKFASRLKENQSSNCVLFVGESYFTLKNSVREFAKTLDIDAELIGKEDETYQIVLNIINKINNSSGTRPWVFIFDNVDNKDVAENGVQPLVNMLQNNSMFMTIVTSRLPGAIDGEGVNLELLSWDNTEAAEFVQNNLDKPGTAETVRLLCQTFDNLPLALDVAVALIVKKRRVSIRGCSYGIQDFVNEIDLDKDNKKDRIWDKLATLWRFSLDSVREEDPLGPAATELMCCLGFLNPDSIGVQTLSKLLYISATKENESKTQGFLTRILHMLVAQFSPVSRCSLWEILVSLEQSAIIVEKSLELLKSYSLVRVEDSIVSVHRLFQQVIRREYMGDFSPKNPLEILSLGICELLLETEEFDNDTLLQAIALWDHLKQTDKLIAKYKSMPSMLAEWMWQLGFNIEAMEFLLANESKMMSLLPQTDKDFIMFQKSLATAYHINEKFPEAKRLLENFLPVMESVFGEMNEKTINANLTFAALLRNEGKVEESWKIYLLQLKFAQFIAQQFSDEKESTLTVKIKQKLAHMYGREGNFDKELELLTEIIQWRESNQESQYETEKKIKKDLLSTLRTKHNLGCCLMRLKRYREAKLVFQDIFNKRNEILREDHPSTLNTKQYLAEAMLQDGENKEEKTLAISYLKEILPMKIKKHGENHSRTKQTVDAINKWTIQLDCAEVF